MDKFLKRYYKQLHFNSMPADVRKRFFEWVKNGTLTLAMQNWVRDYLEHDPNTNELMVDGDGNYILKALPDPDTVDPENENGLSDDAAKDLFITFQHAFAGMAADIKTYQDSEPQSKNFVNLYFGPNKLFNVSGAANQAVVDGITAITDLIKTNAQVKRIVLAGESDGKKLFDNETKLNEFLNKCDQAKYNSDGSVQSKLQKVATVLESASWSYASTEVGHKISNIQDALNSVMDPSAFAMDPGSIDPTKLAQFRAIYLKGTQQENGLLQTLYHNKTIRERFAKYDAGAITGPIGKAEENVNWQDKSKENYVDPKIDDVLTPWQSLEKWVTDTYADTFKKYEELRGGHKFFQQEAKDIFKAIDKEKVKPVDGVKAILDKKAAIEDRLNNPVAKQHFKWFTEIMGPLTKKMPKAVEGAWKDAEQMKAIISQIILNATDPNNDDPDAIAKAKTAMEIMTAMKYGMMTSKIMDGIKSDKDLFSFFSNKDLSWNKSEGVKFITNAMDKTVRLAFLGLGYSVTIVKNKIKMSGMKYKDKDNQGQGGLAERFNRENTTKQQALRDQNTVETPILAAKIREKAQLNTGLNPINDNNLPQHEGNLSQLDANMQQQESIKQQHQTGYDAYNQGKQIVDADTDNQNTLAQLNQSVTQLQNDVTQTQNQLNDPNTYANLPQAAASALAVQIRQQLTGLQQQLQQAIQQRDAKQNELNDPQYRQNLTDANNTMTANQAAFNAYTQADNAYNRYKTAHDDLNEKIESFKEATKTIEELQTAIDERTRALQNWPQNNTNKVIELENYWNFLQDKTTTWGFSLKKAQDRFDAGKVGMLQQYINRNGLSV